MPDAGDVVKITTSLVQMDVTVVDSKGRVITDLKKDEFELYENGQKQDISAFSFISSIRERSAVPEKTVTGQTLPPIEVKPEQVKRTVALVVDDLTLSFESVYYVRRALKKYVDEQMQPGDLVAILRTGAGIGALQQFTSDKRMLYAAIDKIKWNAYASGRIGAFEPVLAKAPGEESRPSGGMEAPAARSTDEAEQDNEDLRASIFATGTLGAVSYVVRGMKELPGRKSVMLLSEGFKLYETDPNGSRSTGRVYEALTKLVDMANRSAVVIYTIDARGLQSTAPTAEDDFSGRSTYEIASVETSRSAHLLDTQDGLRFLSKQTGGRSFFNNNDLSGSIKKVLDDQSYYLVGYEPDSDTFDPKVKFNKIVIKVKRPGASVRYRSGFFSVPDKERDLATAPANSIDKLNEALTSPFAVNGIALRLNGLFGIDKQHGSFVRTLTHISPNDIGFKTMPDGSHQAIFDLIEIAYGDNGIPVDRVVKTYTMTVKDESFKQLSQKGFVYDLDFPVKKPGAYQLRVAIHDHGSDKTGSANQFIEVPDLKKGRLTISGVVLRNLTKQDAEQEQKGIKPASGNIPDPLLDTSLRQFKRGTVLDYGFSIYNAKGGADGLTSQLSIFRDGKQIFTGMVQPVTTGATTGDNSIDFAASLSLGKDLQPGDYVLQIEIVDKNAKNKHRSATQFVQFEIIQ